MVINKVTFTRGESGRVRTHISLLGESGRVRLVGIDQVRVRDAQ